MSRTVEYWLLLFIYLQEQSGKMIGKRDDKICPICGGQLEPGIATVVRPRIWTQNHESIRSLRLWLAASNSAGGK
jgi:hypothetical protein